MRRPLTIALTIWLVGMALLAGCETSFEVFGDSDEIYSLFGVLDASQDTQFVRVELLQDSMLTDTGPIDAVVTMKTMSSGETVQWNDSLFYFIGGARAHNFWTTEPIVAEETYRLNVRRSDGESSSATITLPEEFRDPRFTAFPFSLINLPVSGNVCARDFDMEVRVEELAALEMVYYVPTRRENETVFRKNYIPKAVKFPDGRFEVTIEWVADLIELGQVDEEVGLQQMINTRAIVLRVASAGPNWPDNALDDETVALPDAVTFVDNGFGFVGGVISKRIELPLGDYRDASCFQ